MGNPTPDQITTVQTNLTNMWSFIDDFHQNGIDKINNAYLLQSQPQTVDVGEMEIFNVLGGALWGLSDFELPGINFGLGLFTGILQQFTVSNPPDWPATFANVWQRYDSTILGIETCLANSNSMLFTDPSSIWDLALTGFDGQQYTVGDLVNVNFPVKATADYMSLMTELLTKFDYNLWKSTLNKGFFSCGWDDNPICIYEPQTWNITSWSIGYVSQYPASILGISWYSDVGCCTDGSCWHVIETWLSLNDGSCAANDLCSYLFQDDGGGSIINPSGVATREDVFTNWGLPSMTVVDESTEHPIIYMMTANPPKTIQELLKTSTRAELEAKVVVASEDPTTKMLLRRNPRQALYNILGLDVPNNINIAVLDEKSNQFYVVLPRIG
jgi:hypothetical protein